MSPELQFRPRRRFLNPSLLILFGIAVVLSVLAVLQYRWITEVSNAEQARLKENLAFAVALSKTRSAASR